MFFFFPDTYWPMACIKWVLPSPTPPYTRRGLYVRAGACATARLAACAISLFGPTTKDSNVFRGLSPRTLALVFAPADGSGEISLRTGKSSNGVCPDVPEGEANFTARGLPSALTIAFCNAVM